MTLLTRDLNCQHAVELVTDYIEGRMSRRQRRRFEKHLQACSGCSRYLEQIRTTIALTGRIDADELDEGTRTDLLELYRRYRDSS